MFSVKLQTKRISRTLGSRLESGRPARGRRFESCHFRTLCISEPQENKSPDAFDTKTGEKPSLQRESSDRVKSKKAPTRTQLEHSWTGFLTIAQAAEVAGVAVPTIRRWCESGKLVAIPQHYGSKTTWMISLQGLALHQQSIAKAKSEALKAKSPEQSLSELQQGWQSMIVRGGIYPRPYSHKTAKDYHWFTSRFISAHKSFTVGNARDFLMSFPAHQDTTREHAYKALTSFAKYLQHKGVITPAQLVELKTIRPRRRKDPQRSIPVEEEVQQLMHEARHSKHWAMVALMVHAGLRAHEVAQLSWKDINLENQVIVVQGKGGKRRFVGINATLLEALKAHQTVANPHEVPLLFYDTKGKPLTGDGVWKRVNTLSKRGGFHTSPHALRRYFATNAAMSGRSLATLQRVLGHSNLSTTEQYIRATSLQAAEEMKGWD